MKMKKRGLVMVILVVGVMAGFGVVMAGEPGSGGAAAVEAKGTWVKVEGRVLKNDVQVSQPAMKTLSGRAVQVAMQAWDKDGQSSHLMLDLVPVVVGNVVEVKGEVSVAVKDGAENTVVARVDERVERGKVMKAAAELHGDQYVFEFKFEAEAQK